jgi:hypothetical protein
MPTSSIVSPLQSKAFPNSRIVYPVHLFCLTGLILHGSKGESNARYVASSMKIVPFMFGCSQTERDRVALKAYSVSALQRDMIVVAERIILHQHNPHVLPGCAIDELFDNVVNVFIRLLRPVQ